MELADLSKQTRLPIDRIASGGELSRFLLALKVCLAARAPGLTLIFDEIDRGVGGATADAVGRRLQALGQGAQVLVVTHSPQVAARGAHHWQVGKRLTQGASRTEIAGLGTDARVEEIARMLAGDVITEIDGASIKDSRELARKVGMMAPGTKIKVTLVRKGEIKNLALTLGKMPNEQHAKADTNDEMSGGDSPRLGLNLAPAKDVAGSGDQGVAVVGVDPNGPAAERGIKTGDVILDVGGKAVANTAEVRKALSDARTAGKNTVLLRVKTAEATRFVALPIKKA